MPENAGIRTRRPAPIAGDPLQHGQEAGRSVTGSAPLTAAS